MLEGTTAIVFYMVSFVVVLGAIGVVTLKNIFHAALLLVVTLFGVAAVFVLLSADFLAAVQVLIYVGAISVLMVFAVMLTAQLTNYEIKQTNEQSFPALILVCSFIVLVILAISANAKLGGFTIASEPQVTGSTTVTLGSLLMKDFVLPFEVVSVLLLAALIGAIVIAKRDKP